MEIATTSNVRFTLTPKSQGRWVINDLLTGTLQGFESWSAASTAYDVLTGRNQVATASPER